LLKILHAIISNKYQIGEPLLKHRNFLLAVLILSGMIVFGLALQGCQIEDGAPAFDDNLNWLTVIETPPTIFETNFDQIQDQTEREPTAQEFDQDDQSFWPSFPPPAIQPATPIPPPLERLEIDDHILVWVLLGTDTEPPFSGKTQAIHLVFINPRFSKASLISIPGDLYVYIPGFTMQRLSTAYAIGGIETLRTTLAYNFGVLPSRFVLAHPGDFQWLVDDINGIEVTVFQPIPHACGGIPAGVIPMDGTLALCYASYRDGMDEISRMQRQQQLLQLIFHNLTHNGNLAKLPTLFASYQGWIKTDFSLPELMGFIPLALRLADPDRIGYFLIGWDQISLWEVPGYSQAMVFLPDQEAIKYVLETALSTILIPSPLTNQVQTLEAQLTAAQQATAIFFQQSTPVPPDLPTPTEPFELSPPWETPGVSATPTTLGYP
jgi:LCP family protein required for cell wall assembly